MSELKSINQMRAARGERTDVDPGPPQSNPAAARATVYEKVVSRDVALNRTEKCSHTNREMSRWDLVPLAEFCK
jgi:hypothetical protein